MKNIFCHKNSWTYFLFAFFSICLRIQGERLDITVDINQKGKEISQHLIGIFFEDLNYAADGGLYAELVQNRSFEYSPADRLEWNSLTAWELVKRDGSEGRVFVNNAQPIHPNNPNYAILGIARGGGGVGLKNSGFDGMVIRAGERYNLSLYARQLAYPEGSLVARLEAKDGRLLGEVKLPTLTSDWKKYTATIQATDSDDNASLLIMAFHPGMIALDMISLFPEKTFKNRPNGLRADLAQTIADLKPAFIRFPGGCLVHGDGLDNLYRWKETIGPIEYRRAQRNIWDYHQTLGIGFYEYFQFCEDIGAEPLPVLPSGVSCQNSGAKVTRRWEEGQRALSLEEMPAYIQDVLDLIEFANSDASTVWGKKRAEMGHPAPFNLKYLAIGNEEKITPQFMERFRMIYDAIKKKHPEIIVIGTAGPRPSGDDFEKGWKFARELSIPVVDEHFYMSPRWFWDNLNRYDKYPRDIKVYAGEYAAHDAKRRTTLRSAIAEAAFLTSVERNGDIVVMASYAPLLCKRGYSRWEPDLIYFTKTNIVRTINYYVQQLFSLTRGDRFISPTISGDAREFAISCVRDSRTGILFIKMVNGADSSLPITINLLGANNQFEAEETLLASENPDIVNSFDNPDFVVPTTSKIAVKNKFEYTLKPYSLSILKIYPE
ncbi:MAG: alpha-N-arabinofuranosidase [Verrucomicrobiae bacterium]|nr:alpha-N-arabinofuranosidase [Verrucomicrobiae bacterium]